jgi:stringent starvation protein B
VYSAVTVPIEAVESIFSFETKQGLEFEIEQSSAVEPLILGGRNKASLHLVN